jgi:hypothetical protein
MITLATFCGIMRIVNCFTEKKIMERYRIKLSQEEFEESKIPSNHVAIELLRVEKDATTKGGVYMGFLETTTWEDERESHPADVASVVGRVVKVPQKLYYNEDDPHNSMPWETDMQLEIGMVIFFSLLQRLSYSTPDCKVHVLSPNLF